MLNVRYDLLGRPLELKKTHDFCASKKPTLTAVFIHGLATDSSSFHNTLKYLEGTTALRGVRFVAFDLLGSGTAYKNNRLSYDYHDQLSALENSLSKLKIGTPLVLIGHSMGTLLATKYAYDRKKAVDKLILCSPAFYTEQELDHPAFEMAMTAFRNAVSVHNHAIVKEKSFNNSIEKIVKNRKNYKRLVGLTTPTVLIYGEFDRIIAPHNLIKAAKENPEYLTTARVAGRHGMSRNKYSKIREILEEMVNAQTL